MKLSVGKWNVSHVGENKPVYYFGFKTKKNAQVFCENWNKDHDLKIKVIKCY